MLQGRIGQLIPSRTTLRTQASRRLLIVSLIAITLIFTVGFVSYNVLVKRDLDQRRAEVTAYYAKALPRVESTQQMEALRLASRIELTRIMEQSEETRWALLTTFLNAQRTFNEFSSLAIQNEQGEFLYRYEQEPQVLERIREEDNDWIFVPENYQLYRLRRAPIWLGAKRQGRLLLLKPMANSALRDLAVPQTRLQLHFDGRVIADSGEEEEAPPGNPDRFLRVEIPLPPRDGVHQDLHPTLIVYRNLKDQLPFIQFVSRPILVSLVIIALLWYGLGRWLTRTTQRIEALGRGALNYAQLRDRSVLTPALAPALRHDDEIKTTARAFEHLVEVIEARDQEQRSYIETLALLDEAVIEFDAGGRILRASPGWSKLCRNCTALGGNLDQYIHPEDVSLVQAQSEALASGEKHSVILRIRMRSEQDSANSQEFWVEARLLAFQGGKDGITSIRGVLRDITQTYLHEKQITYMALHDALTELPNRVLLEDRFKVALRLARRNGELVGVCFIDLDHFKIVNDTLGHKAGDRLLVSFAMRLRTHLRDGDTLARWGGDEFVLLLPEMKTEEEIRRVASKMVSLLQQPLDVDGDEMRVTFSMGAAIFPTDSDDMESIFSQADRAMFYAKAQGRNQACFFQDMTSKGLGKKDLHIQNRLGLAIDQCLIRPWFQPIVDARTGCCTSLEVLARWNDPGHGWISPSTFIPMAENLGLIGALGNQILLSSLDSLTELRERGFNILVAVNISKRQLFLPAFVEWLQEEIRKRGLHPDQLILEITESVALTDVDRGADIVHELCRAGFQVAIDDFGTGYSSLSQLHEMNATELKIDISFVRRLNEADGSSIVQAIINMAQALKMKTVAEGVETVECATHLTQMGVDCLQGFLFAPPMPLPEFVEWLEQNRKSQCEARPPLSGD